MKLEFNGREMPRYVTWHLKIGLYAISYVDRKPWKRKKEEEDSRGRLTRHPRICSFIWIIYVMSFLASVKRRFHLWFLVINSLIQSEWQQ